MIFELIMTVCISAISPSTADDFECVVFRQQMTETECTYYRDEHNGPDSKYLRKWVVGEIDAREIDKAILMEPAECKDTGYRP